MRHRHEQLLRCGLMLLVARLVKLSSNLSRTAGRQLFKIGDRLPTVTLSLPFGTFTSGAKFLAQNYGRTTSAPVQ
jgi:hypothetical protein